MRKVTVFSGNRAEFGILFPIIAEISKEYEVDVLLSGAHVLPPWNTKAAVEEQLTQNNIGCTIATIPLKKKEDTYLNSLGEIYEGTLQYFIRHKDKDLAIVLGDRIESFAFALGAFYSQIPLIHLCGGDVVNDPSFDTNVRHSISKLANYHFVMSDRSKKALMQMGEEEHRILNMGNPSFDYERMGYLTSVEMLEKEFDIAPKDSIVIFTFHPVLKKSGEMNFLEFKTCLEAILETNIDKVIATYPNNDPGYEQIVEYLESFDENQRICRVKNLGTYNYLSLMKNFKTIVAGNSSSGLLETVWYGVPTLNIGERQGDRIRGNNVISVTVDKELIRTELQKVLDHYEEVKEQNKKTRTLFGNGEAALKAKDFIDSVMKLNKNEQLFKRFVERLDN